MKIKFNVAGYGALRYLEVQCAACGATLTQESDGLLTHPTEESCGFLWLKTRTSRCEHAHGGKFCIEANLIETR